MTFRLTVSLACLFGILVAVPMAGAQTQQQRQVDTCRDGSPDEQIKACTALIKRGGRDLEAYYHNRSRGWAAKGECDPALADAEKALSLMRDEANFAQVGVVLSDCKGDHARAAKVYSDGIKAFPKSALMFHRRGALLGILNEPERALADYDQAIRLEPGEAEHYIKRADAYGELEDWDKAIADLNKAIGMKPDIAGAYSVRGLAFSKKGDTAKAEADLDRAIRLDPKRDGGFAYRAAHYRDIGDYEKALADHARSIELLADAANYFARAKTLRLKGDLDLALADTNESVKLETRPFWSLQQRGIVYRYRGDYDRAIADFDRLLRDYPDTAAAYVERGRAYEKKGDLVRARADFERALTARGSRFKTAHDDARSQLAALDAPAPVETSSPAAPIVATGQGRRVALVIGNSDYVHAAKLTNPARDAQAVAASLRAVGFETVMVGNDLSR